jgi:sigma-B regulation protein RsbU (phosphoserine phosphatase)
MSGAQFIDRSIQLDPGDSLLLITDGIPECFNSAGEAFGDDRLNTLLGRCPRSEIGHTLDAIFAALDAFREDRPPSDDVTALMVHFNQQRLSA